MNPAATAASRFMSAVTAAHEPGLDPVERADRRTSKADASAAHLIACGYDPNEITSLGLRMDRAGYENVRADWQRTLAAHPDDEYYQRDAATARAHWLTLRPEWDDDWATPERQICRKGAHDCIPAVTLTWDNGTRRLHWCAEHAADADRYRTQQ